MEIPFLLIEDQMCMVLDSLFDSCEDERKAFKNDLTYDNIVYELIEELEHQIQNGNKEFAKREPTFHPESE